MAQMNLNALSSLFLRQSYDDCRADFLRSLNDPSFTRFDVIVLTAANDLQAEMFRRQLASRHLPSGTEFAVITDRDGKRVGSGGATLSVIKYIKEKYGSFSGLRVACIHSGGDSKRVPNYSAIGKLFSPVPTLLRNGVSSTLFDEFMMCLSSLAGRINEGMFLFSGDILMLFNPLQVDFDGSGAAAISFKENVNICVNHGVFLGGEDGYVCRFLHKQKKEILQRFGAVDKKGNCCLDTGALIFAADLLESLYKLVQNDSDAEKLINSKIRLSLYGDFLYPLAEDSTLDSYLAEAPEGEMSDDLIDARHLVWNTLEKYRLRLLSISPAKFLHFGTTSEVLTLMNYSWHDYSQLGWKKRINSFVPSDSCSACNSVVEDNVRIGDGVYVEVSHIHGNTSIGDGCLISYIEIQDEVIPPGVVLHGLKLQNGSFVCRIYGVNDNPKQDRIFGKNLKEELNINSKSLWSAKIYPVKATPKEAVEAALNIYKIVADGTGDMASWLASEKISLEDGFNDFDPTAVMEWSEHMKAIVFVNKLRSDIDQNKSYRIKSYENYGFTSINALDEWIANKYNNSSGLTFKDFSEYIRLNIILSDALNDDKYAKQAFTAISREILHANNAYSAFDNSYRNVKDEVNVQLPLRVNFGGGWTDTPPYCLENGGAVLNAAITLSGQLPVTAHIRRIEDKKIILSSSDLNSRRSFTDLRSFRSEGNPFDVFALPKACLLATGVLPFEGSDLNEIIDTIGGGFELSTEVNGVPKGSGLGTSSILAAACCKAIFEFFGKSYDLMDVCTAVLSAEQIMTTGGGWQDQLGGYLPGIKLLTSKPGFKQNIDAEILSLSDATKQELNDRYCLIYTGQRRLARNILRDVVGRYLNGDSDALYAYTETAKLATDMKLLLMDGDIDGLAEAFNHQWKCNKFIDGGVTNTLIDYIFLSIEDLINGRFVCGAGGGGFLQVILKKDVSKEDLRNRINDVFMDFGCKTWESRFLL